MPRGSESRNRLGGGGGAPTGPVFFLRSSRHNWEGHRRTDAIVGVSGWSDRSRRTRASWSNSMLAMKCLRVMTPGGVIRSLLAAVLVLLGATTPAHAQTDEQLAH